MMGRRNLLINLDVIRNLYLNGLTSQEIGERFDCTDVTIRNKLKKQGIKLRTGGRKRFKYPKYPFNGTLEERLYMIGFRIGDLNVYIPSQNSRIIVVRCNTTQNEQLQVIKSLFSKYGRITVSQNLRNLNKHVNCYLDHSFKFLLSKKELPKELNAAFLYGWPFVAGYVDAEGNFIINQNRGRFKIDSYDEFILNWMHNFFLKNGINSKLRLLAKKGEWSHQNYRWKNNLWRLNINDMKSLEIFLDHLYSYLRHKKRIKDAGKVLDNIKSRKKL